MPHRYLHRAPSGIFHLRVPVPPAARAAFGRREIKQTLRTRDLPQALEAARRYLPGILSQLNVARQTMDSDKLKRLLRDPNTQLSHFTARITLPTDSNQAKQIEIEVDPEKPGDKEAAVEFVREIQGTGTPPSAAADAGAQPANAAAASTPSPEAAKTVLALFDDYALYKEREGDWTANTRAEVYPRFVVFHDLVNELPVGDITPDHADTWRIRLHDLPKDYRKRYPDLSVQDVLARVAREPQRGAPLIANDTIRKHVQSIKPFFDWLVHQTRCLAHSPVANIRPPKKPKRQRQARYRTPYSTQDLERIFSVQQFKDHTYRHPFEYWAALIALFTGARANEIAQLHVEDIRKLDTFWVFDFNEHDPARTKKRLKTGDSARLIPIHPKLIDLGLLDYVKEHRDDPSGRLFPELRYTQKAGYAKQISAWYNGHDAGRDRHNKRRYYPGIKEQAGFARGSGRDFHTFRATIASRLKNVHHRKENEYAAILGHANKTVTEKHYADSYTAPQLKAVIDVPDFEQELANVQPYRTATFKSAAQRRSRKRTAGRKPPSC